MNAEMFLERFRTLSQTALRRPGAGDTAERHRAIFAAGHEDLSLAKLIEGHWDAVAILEEAGTDIVSNTAYAVWASEAAGSPLLLENGALYGTKEFCSGAALVDRALVTAGKTLVEVDLRAAPEALKIDETGWRTDAFRTARTATMTFSGYPIISTVGTDNWYTHRVGFWQGACGPAAAWAGGAAGLVDYALEAKRDDPHTTAHVGAMCADVWAMEALLSSIGDMFDREPNANFMVQALEIRHVIEQMCTDVLRRFARALGPAPLVKKSAIAQRYAELDLYLRQSHAERDLEVLGNTLRMTIRTP